MKILFVTTLDLQIDTFHHRTIKYLADEGNIVDVATNGTKTWEGVHAKYTVPFHRNPLHPDNLKATNTLRKLIQENRQNEERQLEMAENFKKIFEKAKRK